LLTSHRYDGPPRESVQPMLRIASTSFLTDRQCLHRLRAWVCTRLISAPHGSRLSEVLVCVNELASNAVRHSASGQAGGSFLLSLAWDQASLRVTITDQGGSGQPELQLPSDDAETGRGLHVVAGLADRWGFEVTSLGCQVWVELAADDKNTDTSTGKDACGTPASPAASAPCSGPRSSRSLGS
jgi:anti-sigma regulatory factor (Ser/Thr protein kinase)